ncbi:MAG: Flp family type IVb pilin [Thermaerobacter sp.]|nr:Flp family type IVb pilin [Thermaerobacter sp.]
MAGLMVLNLLRRLRASEGQGMVEYALIIFLVAVAVIGVLTALGGGVSNVLNQITHSL